MKSAKKTIKESIFLNTKKPIKKQLNLKSQNMEASQEHTNFQSSVEHRKLLEYRDYLLSLRKMDLGNLIKKSSCNNHQRGLNKCKKENSPIFSDVKHVIKQKQTPCMRNTQGSSQLPQKNRENEKKQKIQIQSVTITQQKISQSLRQTQKCPKRQFKLDLLQNNLNEDDLFCNEDMEDLMKLKKPSTPRLIHMTNYGSSDKDFLTHRSSRCRDFSMPSIEERNLSEQSQDSLHLNQKSGSGSMSNNQSHRKYNSCSHAQSTFQYDSMVQEQTSKRKSSNLAVLTSRSRKQLETNSKIDKLNLQSTSDKLSTSENKLTDRSHNENSHKNIKVNPFSFNKSELHPEKQDHRLSLNVSEIVRRISSRSSKSSMSDKSYQKKHQSNLNNSDSKNLNKTNTQKKSRQFLNHEEQFDISIKDLARLPNDCVAEMVQVGKKKSFKFQVKEFRQKHYLMMKLAGQ